MSIMHSFEQPIPEKKELSWTANFSKRLRDWVTKQAGKNYMTNTGPFTWCMWKIWTPGDKLLQEKISYPCHYGDIKNIK